MEVVIDPLWKLMPYLVLRDFSYQGDEFIPCPVGGYSVNWVKNHDHINDPPCIYFPDLQSMAKFFYGLKSIDDHLRCLKTPEAIASGVTADASGQYSEPMIEDFRAPLMFDVNGTPTQYMTGEVWHANDSFPFRLGFGLRDYFSVPAVTLKDIRHIDKEGRQVTGDLSIFYLGRNGVQVWEQDYQIGNMRYSMPITHYTQSINVLDKQLPPLYDLEFFFE